MNQEALVEKRKSIYVVWLIPFLAMAIAGWMIYKYYDNKGTDIIIVFDKGEGLVAGKTPLKYNGIQVGKVIDMHVNNKNISKIDVTVTVDKNAIAGIAREGNLFWKVEPKLSLTEVSGLETVLGGVYIDVIPGADNIEQLIKLPYKTSFEAVHNEPVNIFEPGIHLILHAKNSDIQTGAPVMFRKINVGKILESKLTDTGVDHIVFIANKYAYLIKENSKFWKISGVEIRASLAGLRVEMESLASVIAGGVQFSSPEDGTVVTDDNHAYHLYENRNYLELDPDVITLVSKSGYNIDEKASHVYFKGVVAGDIISIDYDPAEDKTTFNIKLKKSFRHLANKDAHFWIVEPHIGLSAFEGLDALTGRYITFETKSRSKELKQKFVLHKDAPTISGIHVKLLANNAYALKNGVNVIYRDIIIGFVRSLKLQKDGEKVALDIVIANKYKHLLNDTSNFYVKGSVESEASFDGVYFNIGSIASIVNGDIVLETKDLSASRSKRSFELLQSRKAFLEKDYTHNGGKMLLLTADALNSIKKGSPLIFKGINVGKVIDYELNKKTGKIDIKVYIEEKYSNQINVTTSFYNVSGIQVQAGLDGVKINTGSIESIVRGGISFKTPLQAEGVKEMSQFELYPDEDAVDNKYIEIKLLTENALTLKEGSKLIYKSITIGRIKSMRLVKDQLELTALIDHEYKDFLAEDSLFWAEDIIVKIDTIRNPSALIGGAFISILPGQSKMLGKSFSLEEKPPVDSINKEGLRVIVTGSRLSSLHEGSPVFYRQIKIGNVERYRLNNESTGVDFQLYIDKCYAHLVRQNSLFYNATALGMDVSLFGVKIRTETVSTMINGGIALATPEKEFEEADFMQRFKLHDQPEDEWLSWEPKIIRDQTGCYF